MKFSMDSVLSWRMPRLFDRVRERDCGNVTLKEVGGNEGQFKEVLSCNRVLQLQKLSPLSPPKS